MTERKRPPRIETESVDLNAERLETLKDLYPEAFTEGKVDFDKLREALGDLVDDLPERYSFSWSGKRDAIRLLQTPSRATLRPARDESVAFDDTKHLFIEGDNLEVLKLLYKSYAGRVKMIYIDPPYNTGKDFIYPDNFADPLDTYLRLTGQKDAAGNVLTSNPETSGRYHSAWLSMMYPRLFVARQLLREDGVRSGDTIPIFAAPGSVRVPIRGRLTVPHFPCFSTAFGLLPTVSYFLTLFPKPSQWTNPRDVGILLSGWKRRRLPRP